MNYSWKLIKKDCKESNNHYYLFETNFNNTHKIKLEIFITPTIDKLDKKRIIFAKINCNKSFDYSDKLHAISDDIFEISSEYENNNHKLFNTFFVAYYNNKNVLYTFGDYTI